MENIVNIEKVQKAVKILLHTPVLKQAKIYELHYMTKELMKEGATGVLLYSDIYTYGYIEGVRSERARRKK